MSFGEPPVRKQQTLQISLLGEFRLLFGETAVSLDTPSYQSVLAYLLVYADRAHMRRQLAFHFWPDSTEAQARTNLRKAIFTLRQTLPAADRFLAGERQTLRWGKEASCVVDVAAYAETAVNHPTARIAEILNGGPQAYIWIEIVEPAGQVLGHHYMTESSAHYGVKPTSLHAFAGEAAALAPLRRKGASLSNKIRLC